MTQYPEATGDVEFHKASLAAYAPLMQFSGVPIGSINCESWGNSAAFGGVADTEKYCTTAIFDQAN